MPQLISSRVWKEFEVTPDLAARIIINERTARSSRHRGSRSAVALFRMEI
jgi:hypothetical protein